MLPYLLFSLATFSVLGAFMVYVLLRSYLTAEPTVSVLLTAGSALVAGKPIPLYLEKLTLFSSLTQHDSSISPSSFPTLSLRNGPTTTYFFIVSLRLFWSRDSSVGI
jgi:hypothetical protein